MPAYLWFIAYLLVGAVSSYKYLRLINPHLREEPMARVALGVISCLCSFMGPLPWIPYGLTRLAMKAEQQGT
jgi:hypothetical protein